MEFETKLNITDQKPKSQRNLKLNHRPNINGNKKFQTYLKSNPNIRKDKSKAECFDCSKLVTSLDNAATARVLGNKTKTLDVLLHLGL